MKELQFLRSNRFVLYVAIFTVLFLAPNTYFVYYTFSVFISPWREIASAGVALIIASAIMIYTIRKNEQVALHFAYFEVMVSSYYYIDTLGLDWALIPALGFAIILPYSVSKYTKELDFHRTEEPPVKIPDQVIEKFMDENPETKPPTTKYWFDERK